VLFEAASKLSLQGLLPFQEEAVRNGVCVKAGSGDRPRWVDARGGARNRALGIERRNGAVTSAQKAVCSAARVSVGSRGRQRRVDSDAALPRTLEGTCARARNIERRERTVGSPQEAVRREARVVIVPRDCPFRVDAVAGGEGVQGTWSIERRYRAVGGPQEAVEQNGEGEGLAGEDDVVSCDRPCRIDAVGRGQQGTWSVERRERAVGSTQETVSHQAGVEVGSRNRPVRADG
jgi:hypothetical protein